MLSGRVTRFGPSGENGGATCIAAPPEPKRSRSRSESDGGDQPPDENEDLQLVTRAFGRYAAVAHRSVILPFQKLQMNPRNYVLLPDLSERVGRMMTAVKSNADLLKDIAASCGSPSNEGRPPPEQGGLAEELDEQELVRAVIVQLAREWSVHGAQERQEQHEAILGALQRSLEQESTGARVLVPGAGLGRLASELAADGYHVRAIELSQYMALPAHFILNMVRNPECVTIYPWVTSPANCLKVEDCLQSFKVPDVPAGELLHRAGSLEYHLGDFVETAGQSEEAGLWDAVVTHFFIDTAHDIFDYLHTIYQCLREGGVWVNLGPLLWHHNELSETPTAQLCMDELVQAANGIGLRVDQCTELCCKFGQNERSMLATDYKCQLLTATKVTLQPPVGLAVGDRALVNLGAKWATGTVKKVNEVPIDQLAAARPFTCPSGSRPPMEIPYVVQMDPPLSKLKSVMIDHPRICRREACVPIGCNTSLSGQDVAPEKLLQWCVAPSEPTQPSAEATEPTQLRFKQGDGVRCCIGVAGGPDEGRAIRWLAGKVEQVGFRQSHWPERLVVPYLVQVDGVGQVAVQRDDENLVQKDDDRGWNEGN